jgi:hypothetical protein
VVAGRDLQGLDQDLAMVELNDAGFFVGARKIRRIAVQPNGGVQIRHDEDSLVQRWPAAITKSCAPPREARRQRIVVTRLRESRWNGITFSGAASECERCKYHLRNRKSPEAIKTGRSTPSFARIAGEADRV